MIVGQDGTGKGRYIVQDIESIPLDESAKQYLLDQDLGYSFFKVPETKAVEIDFLTGKPINSQNGTYQVSHTIDGKSYVVDYHSCATPECVATNSNMVQNAASDAFIDATSAKALDDASKLANGALLLTPYGAASNVRHVQHLDKIKVVGEVLNQGASFGSAYLNGEIGKFGTEEAFSRTMGKMLVETLGKGKGEKVNVYIDTFGIGDIGEVLPEDKAIEEEFKSYVQGATE